MYPFRFNGYVIVSAEGMLSNSHGVMPETLKFPGDLAFFTAGLDRADLIVHGKNSFEDQPNSPKRTRIVLSRTVEALAPDPDNAKATPGLAITKLDGSAKGGVLAAIARQCPKPVRFIGVGESIDDLRPVFGK